MRAAARVVAVSDGAGGTRMAVLRGDPPLLPRLTGTGGRAEVHLVGGAAGPIGGDELRLDIEIGQAATLVVRTVAATVALPGPDGAPSHVDVRVSVADDGCLWWVPEPLVAATHCRHVTSSTVELADRARLVWRDELVCGRYGETPGDARITTDVTLAGRPLYRHELAVGPNAAGWDGPAVLGPARAAGSVLVVDPRPPTATAPADGYAAVLSLAGPAVLLTAVGTDLREVRARLDKLGGGALDALGPRTR
jgi:urease accessory protein